MCVHSDPQALTHIQQHSCRTQRLSETKHSAKAAVSELRLPREMAILVLWFCVQELVADPQLCVANRRPEMLSISPEIVEFGIFNETTLCLL